MKDPPRFKRQAHVAHDHPASCRRPKRFTEVETRLRTPLVHDRYLLIAFSPFIGPIFKVRKSEGFRRRPLAMVGRAPGSGAQKPPKRKPRGGRGPLGKRDYGDLRIADGWRARRPQPAALGVLVGSGDGGRFRWRRCAEARLREDEIDFTVKARA